MTTEKMPDEMYLTFELPGAVYRYTRAEPIEVLLEQALDTLILAREYYQIFTAPNKVDDAITSIEKFLTTTKGVSNGQPT